MHNGSSAQHIGEGGNVFPVFDGFMERFGELLGNKDGKICISTLFMGVGMAVHRHEAIIVFRDHKAVRIHAESTDPVVKGFGEINKFRLVGDAGNGLIDFCRRFHADSDVYGIGCRLEANPFCFGRKPFGAIPARSGNEILTVVRLSAGFHAFDLSIFDEDMVYGALRNHGHIGREGISHIRENFPVHVGPQMSDAGRNIGQIGSGSFPLQFVDFFQMFIAIDLPSFSAESAVYVIHIGNQAGQLPFIHIIIEIAAIIRGEGQFPVGESAGPAPAGDDICPLVLRWRLSVFIQCDSFADIQPFFENQDGKTCIGQFQGSKDSCRTGPDDNDVIIFHTNTPVYKIFTCPWGKAGNKKAPFRGPDNRVIPFLILQEGEGIFKFFMEIKSICM